MTEEIRVIKRYESFILGKCRCGCNKEISLLSKHRKELRRYYHISHSTGKRKDIRTGKRYLNGKHWWIYKPDYFSSYENGCVIEHIYIYQEYYKCCMLPWGDIHHVDGISDSENANRIENLKGMMHYQHARISHKKDLSDRKCSKCNSNETKLKQGNPMWFKDGENGFWCSKCYDKQYRLKKKNELLIPLMSFTSNTPSLCICTE